MSTVRQDNYVMEMYVQQEEWAKQKETYREEKSVLGGERQPTQHVFIHKELITINVLAKSGENT